MTMGTVCHLTTTSANDADIKPNFRLIQPGRVRWREVHRHAVLHHHFYYSKVSDSNLGERLHFIHLAIVREQIGMPAKSVPDHAQPKAVPCSPRPLQPSRRFHCAGPHVCIDCSSKGKGLYPWALPAPYRLTA